VCDSLVSVQITLRGKRAAKRRQGDFTEEDSIHSDEDNPQVLHDRIFKLENKLRAQRHQLALSEDSNASLRLQVDSTAESLQHALAALKRCEVQLAAVNAELTETKSSLAAENIQVWWLLNT
jgi:septal ring factor EnvC (AmiA/AmiB activator)